jgi:hypothetical protein
MECRLPIDGVGLHPPAGRSTAACPCRRLRRAPQVELLDFGSPLASKPNVVAYDRHVVFASDDPADAARHRAPCPISTIRIDEAFVHELPEQREGFVFAQADTLAYACERVIGSTSRREMRSLMRMSRCDTISIRDTMSINKHM